MKNRGKSLKQAKKELEKKWEEAPKVINKGGRPTKYKAALIEQTLNYVDRCRRDKVLPLKEELAYILDINGDTIVEWCKKYPGFSAAIKKLELAQCAMLQRGIFEDSKNHGAGGIFLLKNNHGFKDKTETDVTSGGKPLPTPLLTGVKDVHNDDSTN